MGPRWSPERIVIDIDATLVDAGVPEEKARRWTTAPGSGSTRCWRTWTRPTRRSPGCCEAVARRLIPPRRRSMCSIWRWRSLPVDVVSDLDTEIVMRIDSTARPARSAKPRRTRASRSWSGSICSPACANRSCNCPRTRGVRMRQDGTQHDGAQIAEITHVERLDLTPWPEGSRVIIRRERPHPGAQLKFTDADGHRFQATLTDLTGDMVEIERLHRGRGDAENLIRGAKQTGLENLPLRELRAQRRVARAVADRPRPDRLDHQLCLTGELAICEPKSAPIPAAAHRRPARLSTPAERFCAFQPTGPGPGSSPPHSPELRCQPPRTDQTSPPRNNEVRDPALSADGLLSRKPPFTAVLDDGAGPTSTDRRQQRPRDLARVASVASPVSHQQQLHDPG